MVSFRRVEESDPASVMITIFEDEGAVFGDVTGPMQLADAFSQELTGPIPIDHALAAAAEMAGRYGCEIVVKLAEDARWNSAWGELN